MLLAAVVVLSLVALAAAHLGHGALAGMLCFTILFVGVGMVLVEPDR